MMPRTVSAVRISRTSLAWASDHLPHFARWLAFPTADYYWGSVTLGLAPRRRSRGTSSMDVLARRRCLVRLRERTTGPSFDGRTVNSSEPVTGVHREGDHPRSLSVDHA